MSAFCQKCRRLVCLEFGKFVETGKRCIKPLCVACGSILLAAPEGEKQIPAPAPLYADTHQEHSHESFSTESANDSTPRTMVNTTTTSGPHSQFWHG